METSVSAAIFRLRAPRPMLRTRSLKAAPLLAIGFSSERFPFARIAAPTPPALSPFTTALF